MARFSNSPCPGGAIIEEVDALVVFGFSGGGEGLLLNPASKSEREIADRRGRIVVLFMGGGDAFKELEEGRTRPALAGREGALVGNRTGVSDEKGQKPSNVF